MGISLDDLKNDGNGKQHVPFIPSIEPTDVNAPQSEGNNKGKSISMVTKPKSNNSERETVSFDSKPIREELREKGVANADEENNSILQVGALLKDGVDNPLIQNYQQRKREQMREFFQEQKLEKELTGHSDFDTDGLDMIFEEEENSQDNKVFRQIDLGVSNGDTERVDRTDKSDAVLQEAEEDFSKEYEGSEEEQHRDDESILSDEPDEYGDESGDDESDDATGSDNRYGSSDDNKPGGSYERGSVREGNTVDNKDNTPLVDSVDFTEDDIYTHEKGIESIKAGEAAKEEAIKAKEEAKKAVTVDMEINRKVSEFKSTDDTVLDEDEMEVSDDDEEEDDQTVRREIIKNIISEKIKPVAKKMSLQGYTIAKKGTTSNNIFKSKTVPVGHWVLYNTGTAIDIQEIRGIDIERMEEASRSQYRQREMFQIIYDNVVSPKPASLDAWLKSISFNDLDNLMMAVHIGAFADSNYIPIDCEHKSCPKKYFLTDNIPIMNMVEFKDESVKNKFMDMYNNPNYNPEGWYTTEVIPISEDFAIGFKEPNLYNMVIEINYGDQDFKTKYNRAISAIPFIDNIYQIDPASKSLVPIEWKEFASNPSKTYRSKVLRYDKIISRLTSDELSALEGIIAEINNRDEFIVYKRPEVVCPYCGTTKPEAKPISMAQTVFSRNQLAALAVSLEN